MISGNSHRSFGQHFGRAQSLAASFLLTAAVLLPAAAYGQVAADTEAPATDILEIDAVETEAIETESLETNTDELTGSTVNRQLADVLPADTPLAMFLTVQEETWAALEQFELFAKIAEFGGGAFNPLRLPFLPPELVYGYEDTIRPWIGDGAALAFLPDATPRSIAPTDLDKSIYFVVDIGDRAGLPVLLESLEENRSAALEKSTYSGVELWVWPTYTEFVPTPALPDWEPGLGPEREPDVTPDMDWNLPEAPPEVSPELLPTASPARPPLPLPELLEVPAIPNSPVPNSPVPNIKAATETDIETPLPAEFEEPEFEDAEDAGGLDG